MPTASPQRTLAKPVSHTTSEPVMPSILLVDDQLEESKALSAALRQAGFQVRAENGNLEVCSDGEADVDVVVSKLRLQGNGGGMRLIRSWRQQRPQTPVIAIASENDVDPAMEAMRMGADDCLIQPIHPEQLSASIRRVLSVRRGSPTRSARDSTHGADGLGPMVGKSRAMQHIFDQAHRVAPTSSTLLLTGGTGTGKDLLAGAIHRLSRRRQGPFVAINVAAVPATLIECELFGHVKGAFTDAARERVGRFEAADGGTLFIDEIGDLKLHLQAKLLRVLESRVINRVGSNVEQPIDVRIVAATSRDLEKLVDQGGFREDLYYRLNVVRIELPELRQRREDIPLLIEHFLRELASFHQRAPQRVDAELLEFLCAHLWPGNVRQLKNCLESMVVMSAADELTIDDLPDTIDKLHRRRELSELPLAGHALAHLEQHAIQQTLAQNDGNRSRSAKMLGISVRTLQRKLKQWRAAEV